MIAMEETVFSFNSKLQEAFYFLSVLQKILKSQVLSLYSYQKIKLPFVQSIYTMEQIKQFNDKHQNLACAATRSAVYNCRNCCRD